MQKRYCMRTVMQKKTTPSTAMAKRFFPTMSHARGDRKRFSPENQQVGKLKTESFRIKSKLSIGCVWNQMNGLCLTESFQSISHGLVLHHIDQPTSQAEVREDEENVFQNVIDATNLLHQDTSESNIRLYFRCRYNTFITKQNVC